MKRIAFFLLYLLILLLSIITFIEKSRGTPFVLEHFYGSWWFALLWGILAFTGMLCFFRHKRHRMYSLFLHLSLVIILLGALPSRHVGELSICAKEFRSATTWKRPAADSASVPSRSP